MKLGKLEFTKLKDLIDRGQGLKRKMISFFKKLKNWD